MSCCCASVADSRRGARDFLRSGRCGLVAEAPVMLTGRLIASSQRKFAKSRSRIPRVDFRAHAGGRNLCIERPGRFAYVDTHSRAVVRMKSEQNSSILRHYFSLYVLCVPNTSSELIVRRRMLGTNRGVLERRLWLIWVSSKDTAQAPAT